LPGASPALASAAVPLTYYSGLSLGWTDDALPSLTFAEGRWWQAMDAADEEEAKKGESEAKEAGEDAPAEEAPREAVETPVKKHSEPSSPPPQ
jgi:hypothetical protein